MLLCHIKMVESILLPALAMSAEVPEHPTCPGQSPGTPVQSRPILRSPKALPASQEENTVFV